MTPLQKLKAESGKRFYVIAKVRTCGLQVATKFALNEADFAKLIFKGQYNTNDLVPWQLGTALCNVSRYGRVTWGLFESV
jgi:hypothetical protein